MSGAPEPALIAFCSLVYSAVAVPAFTRLTLTFGYCFSKAATMSLFCGAHAQTVSVDGCCSAAAIAAALLADEAELVADAELVAPAVPVDVVPAAVLEPELE